MNRGEERNFPFLPLFFKFYLREQTPLSPVLQSVQHLCACKKDGRIKQ